MYMKVSQDTFVRQMVGTLQAEAFTGHGLRSLFTVLVGREYGDDREQEFIPEEVAEKYQEYQSFADFKNQTPPQAWPADVQALQAERTTFIPVGVAGFIVSIV